MGSAVLMEAALFIVAAILCAAFGGPLWATAVLAALGVGIILAGRRA